MFQNFVSMCIIDIMANRTENDSYKIFKTTNLLNKLNTYIETGMIIKMTMKSVFSVRTFICKN